MSEHKENVMKKFVALALTAFWLVGLSACSSYPSWVPEWAQIGAESAEATTDGESASEADGDFTWWNPLSWF